MHDIDLAFIICIYTNVSKFDAECVMTQFQILLKEAFVFQKISKSFINVEVSILYDSFTFNFI